MRLLFRQVSDVLWVSQCGKFEIWKVSPGKYLPRKREGAPSEEEGFAMCVKWCETASDLAAIDKQIESLEEKGSSRRHPASQSLHSLASEYLAGAMGSMTDVPSWLRKAAYTIDELNQKVEELKKEKVALQEYINSGKSLEAQFRMNMPPYLQDRGITEEQTIQIALAAAITAQGITAVDLSNPHEAPRVKSLLEEVRKKVSLMKSLLREEV